MPDPPATSSSPCDSKPPPIPPSPSCPASTNTATLRSPQPPRPHLHLHRGSRLWGAALHSIPSPAAYGNLTDQWWSLGFVSQKGSTELTLLSGPVELAKLRGDYNKSWTVFWITAHFLTGAARVVELGVPIWIQP